MRPSGSFFILEGLEVNEFGQMIPYLFGMEIS
jgi:hypothetical protein